jgi:nucleoside phosphorylase
VGTDFLIITALEEEREALLLKLPGARKLPPEGDDVRVYYRANVSTTLPGGAKGTYDVVVTQPLGMGRVEAATATADAIRKWKPRYLLSVGVAGGVAANDVTLGDLIVADQVFDYELQKLSAREAEVRPKSYNADPRLLSAAQNLGGSRWQRTKSKRPRPGAPKRRFGPVASGDKVVADEEALTKLRELFPKLVAGEMDAAGVAAAASQAADAPGFQ